MAYAALVSLSRTIDLILNSHQGSISPQLKNQITSIDKYAIFFQAFLEDFPDKLANCLEGKIREITHVAENIVEYTSEKIHESSVAPTNPMYCNLGYVSQELKRVTKEMELIAEQVMETKDRMLSLGVGSSSLPRSVVPVAKDDVMVGLEDNLMGIKCRLCGESSRLEIVPIVGMGGIGKTTLARNAYFDQLIVEHFDIRAWVTVSQDYSVGEIVSGLLVSLNVPDPEDPRDETTGELEVYKSLKGRRYFIVSEDPKDETTKELRLYKYLKGRRYLIVLDDVWSIKAWDDLKMVFPDDGNGSRIMLTTRLFDVACYADPYSPLHKMQLMDVNQSWNLLRQKVFKHDPCPVDLEYVGKMIARSCRGLPLAIVVIAGLLAVDQTKTGWLSIAEDVNSAISANDEQLDRILSLSYTRLPHHLRPCFLYMGGYPEDYEMRISKLTKLWVSEGFLKPNGCNKSFEEITAEEYVEDLVRRSLVLVTERKSNGRIKSISIHDLMREMCKRKAQEENFCSHACDFLPVPRCRRVSIFHSHINYFRDVYCSTIRTVLGAKCTWLSSFEHFRLLRILDGVKVPELYGDGEPVPSLSVQVFHLIHIRYLAFDYPVRIPAAISNLQNLQSLIISSSKKWKRDPVFIPLPLEIWRLPKLMHLVLFRCLLRFEEGPVFILENLQTLSGVMNIICSEQNLKRIPNLKKLGISYTAWRDIDVDYELHNLVHLQQLENLKLDIEMEMALQFCVPLSLKKLTLKGAELSWKDINNVGKLPNLEVLKLRDKACIGRTWKTTEGRFSQLKFLLFENLYLKNWITEPSHFPSLKCLVICGRYDTIEIPGEIGEIQTLELIEVDSSSESLVRSAKQIQDDQQSCGNDALQVRYI